MARLVFRVVHVAHKNRAELVEAELSVRLWIIDLLALGCRLQHLVICCFVVQSQWDREQVLVNEVERCATEGAEFVHGRTEVAAAMEFFPCPRRFECFSEFGNFIVSAFRLEGFEHFFGSNNTALHRGVCAFDFGKVQSASITAYN